MGSHTPGPWRWTWTPSAHTLDHPSHAPDEVWDGSNPDSDWELDFDILRAADGTSVLAAFSCNDDTALCMVDEDDAHLIQTSPALLEAAGAITRAWSLGRAGTAAEREKLMAAVHKARGRRRTSSGGGAG